MLSPAGFSFGLFGEATPKTEAEGRALEEAAVRGNKEAIERVIMALDSENPYVRRRAALTLGEAAENGQDISKAIKILKKIAKDDPSERVKEAAKEALRAAGILV